MGLREGIRWAVTDWKSVLHCSRQRLALSRLYFRDGSVLIFDEPTAALDANAEFEVIEALRITWEPDTEGKQIRSQEIVKVNLLERLATLCTG